MPFVPLSSAGTQRATTEALPAARVQVALEPHESGVTVLAVEPTGLRAIGQLDLQVADRYRRVLAPPAEEGVYGICVAEVTPAGTILRLGPAETCLPAGDWWRTAATAMDTTTVATTTTAATTAVATTAVAATGRPRPAHRRRPPRFPTGNRAPVRWVLAAATGLLLVGATAQGLTGGAADPAVVAAADTAGVGVPDWEPTPPVTVAPVATVPVEPLPEPVVAAPPPPRRAEPVVAAGLPAGAGADEPAAHPDGDSGSADGHDSAGDAHSESDDEHSDDADGRSGSGSGGEDSDKQDDAKNDENDDEEDAGSVGGRPERQFRNCFEVWAAGADPIRRGHPSYDRLLDLDGDGKACERRP